ncbi:hypothetical protein RB195_007071 [Necator americanus]|uniref:Uncharacterized protein n=1 Tax=Necator americanus TaxID=51031 RepID=A0ABR1BVI7_NECAM
MYHDISALSPEESVIRFNEIRVIRFNEINSEPRPSAEWLAKKKKLRDAWITSSPTTTTTEDALSFSDQSYTLLIAVLGSL